MEGAAKEPVYLWVHDDTVQIRSAKHVWGKLVAETEDVLREETHPDARVALIGPGGEKSLLPTNHKGFSSNPHFAILVWR